MWNLYLNYNNIPKIMGASTKGVNILFEIFSR